jgi:replication factor C subunit 3/5
VVIAAEGVNTTPDGVDAVVRLGGGDMRKTLNILQSTVMATGAGAVDEAAVYSCTGSPLPADIEQCIQVSGLLAMQATGSAWEVLSRMRATQ